MRHLRTLLARIAGIFTRDRTAEDLRDELEAHLRVLRSGALTGASRLARHLWRMTFALFIATMSFFIGQMKVIPKPIRIPGLLAIPVVLVLVALVYWMWRVRFRRSLRGIVAVGAPRAA